MAHISRYIGTIGVFASAITAIAYEFECAVERAYELKRVLFDPPLHRLGEIIAHVLSMAFIWKPDAKAALALDMIGRDVVDPRAGSEREKPFRAFITRVLTHSRKIGDGFDPGAKHGHMMLAA